MTTVKEIQAAIGSLSSGELDWEQWDKEIEADSCSGKLYFLIDEALEDYKHQSDAVKPASWSLNFSMTYEYERASIALREEVARAGTASRRILSLSAMLSLLIALQLTI